MPTLDWIGKDKVINHHNDVPYKVLERKYSYDEDGEHKDDIHSENMIIHGDNLEALKSLLPQYEGKIKCIYIDPPYNTRKSSEKNKAWIYSDSVDDPKIEKWLGVTVGDEGEDLSRHDKWLCMMYPRLVLLNKLLSDKGIVFISIDDNECSYLKIICDDIFGKKNFVAQLIWRSDGNFDNQAKIKNVHEYILCYIKNADEVGLPQAIDPSASENSKIYNQEVRNTVVKNGPKNPMSTIKLPIGFPCSVSDLIIKSRKDKFPYYGADAIIEGGRLINEVEVESGWSSKNILMKYINNGFNPVKDTKGQDTVFEITKTGNIEMIKKRGDPFQIEINGRKILNKLYAELDQLSKSELMYVKTLELTGKIQEYLLELEQNTEYVLEFDMDLDMPALFKSVGIRYEVQETDFFEQIIRYIKIAVNVLATKVFVFINLRSYLTDLQMQELIKEISYQDVKGLFIENHERSCMEGGMRYIIDRDGCEIY